MHLFNYNPYSIVNERPIAKIDAGCNHAPADCFHRGSRGDFFFLQRGSMDNRSKGPAISAQPLERPVGGADRDRTDDPLLAKQVLSQLSYSPIGSAWIED